MLSEVRYGPEGYSYSYTFTHLLSGAFDDCSIMVIQTRPGDVAKSHSYRGHTSYAFAVVDEILS